MSPAPPRDVRREMVRIDNDGVVHPLGKTSSAMLRQRTGVFRAMSAPPHAVFLRRVGEDGHRDAEHGAVVRLAGEITAPGVLCDVVALVAQADWRGELMVLSGEAQRSMYFEAGRVLSAHSNVEGERVGEVMYKLGAITREQVALVMAALKPGKRFGETAVDLGFVTRDKLFGLMGKQTEEIFYASLLEGDGMFYFLDGFDDSRLAARHYLSAQGLLMEGVRRMDEEKYFREKIPSDNHVPTPVAKHRVPSDPEANLRPVFDACDGRRTVKEVARASERDEFEVLQALFQLVQAGAVQIAAPLPTSAEAVVDIFNDVIRAIIGAVAVKGAAEATREHLAAFATGAGVYDSLFLGAGPASDGTLLADVVARNIRTLAGDDALAYLLQWLHDYAAFALFDAGQALGHEDSTALAQHVAERVALLAPARMKLPV